MKNSKELWVVIVFAVGVDYALARFFATDQGETWFFFCLLLFAPMFFSLKSGLVRVVYWRLRGKNQVIEAFFHKMKSGNWSKPDSLLENEIEYLKKVHNDEVIERKERLEAAKLLGAVEALFETQQVISAYQTSSAIKEAMKKYEKYIEVQCGDGRQGF